MNFDKKIKLQKDLKRMQWRKTVKLPGWSLDELLQKTIYAMRSCEEKMKTL